MNNNKVLSSLSLYTELYNSRKYKSQYQILGSFIKFIIVEENITSFSLVKINYHLEDKFGFNLPSAVVKTALKKIKEIELKHGIYYVNKNIDLDFEIKWKIKDTQKNIDGIVECLKKYAKVNNHDSSDYDLSVLCDEFISFMSLDDDKIQECNKILISKFVMYCEENNNDVSKQLDLIRTGGLLYSGLNYSIDEIPYINNKLTIYFATEILFFLVGYDGEIFQNIAQELMNLIKDANRKKRIIEIKIFSETKEEIERYFSSAESLISKKEFAYDQNMAMRSIIDGCKTASDVVRKKVEFYKILNSKYGIKIEDDFNYYDEKLNAYNLETIDCDEDQLKDLTYLSNINKRRMGNKYTDYLNCKYLFITNSKGIKSLQESDDIGIKFNETYLAVSMGFFTNYLWLSLKKGFGAIEAPKHLGVLIKARLILSDIISNNLKNTFREYRKEYEANEISKEDMIAIIAEFKSRECKPENLRYEDLESVLNITPDEIEHYIVENEKIRGRDKKNNKYIEQLTDEKIKLQYKINEYREEDDRNKEIIDKYRGREKLQNEIDKMYIKRDELKKIVKKVRNRFIKYLFINILFIVLLLFLVYNIDSKIVNVISIFASIITLVIPSKICPSYWLIGVYRQYKQEKKELDECNQKIEKLNENKKEMMLLMA